MHVGRKISEHVLIQWKVFNFKVVLVLLFLSILIHKEECRGALKSPYLAEISWMRYLYQVFRKLALTADSFGTIVNRDATLARVADDRWRKDSRHHVVPRGMTCHKSDLTPHCASTCKHSNNSQNIVLCFLELSLIYFWSSCSISNAT